MSSANHAPRKHFRSWANVGTAFTTMSVAAFLAACLFARWTPVYAQDAKQPEKKKETPRKERKTAAPQVKRPVPAAGSQIDAISLAKKVDEETQRLLTAEKMPVSPRSDDAEFLRRVHLDLVGVIPTAEKVKAFLDSTDPGKRAKAIDELLADPRFGKHLAETWASLMVQRENNNKKTNTAPLQSWLADHFNKNTPLDKTVFELLTSTGSEKENGAVAYFVGNPTVDKITDNVTRMFLGVQLQCAQCHNHPFTDYKQAEYWGMAAFFTKVKLTGGNAKNAAKKGESVGITEVSGAVKGKKLPESAKIVPAKFLHAEEPTMTKDEPARPVLAKWLTTPGNPYFARAMVNRFWFQLFARGIVNPVDDMHDDNEATHDALLNLLTDQFQASGCDVKYLVRAICNTETYQRTSRPTEGNADDKTLFSHRRVRVMTPEQLFDSFTVALGKAPDNVQPINGKKGPAATGRDNFITFFRIEDGADSLEYQIGIPQALRLMNSAQLNATTQVITQAMEGTKTPAEVIERLFLRTLSRRPTPPEATRFTAHVSQAANPRTGYGDILWALLNSSEFTMNH
jgi:hypothetical protein